MRTHVDTIITNGHLLTMRGTGVGYVGAGAVAIAGQRIVAVGDSVEILERYSAEKILDATNCAVLPGLIDAHMHTPYAVLRGVAQDIWNWMQIGLAPYAKHLTTEARLAGTRLAILEGLRVGTTTFGDYTYPYAGWAEAYAETGVRACLTAQLNALPAGGMAGWKVGEVYPLDQQQGQRAIDTAIGFVKEWRGSAENRITTMIGPQGPDMLDREQLLQCKQLAQREGVMLHLHTAQGDRETEQMLKRFGKRSIAYLSEIGLLDEQLLAVHLTEATDAEAELVAKSGASMALCSGSIGIIDGIVPPAHVFRQAGGTVCLGSDQASGNNCHNIFNEMKLTALFNKIKFADPTIMPAWDVLRMATIEGARAIGLDADIGSLAVGKQADIIIVDLTEPNLLPILDTPIRTIVPNLVYAGTGREVRDLFVAGRQLVQGGVVIAIDGAKVREDVQMSAEKIAHAVAADPIHHKLALLKPMAAAQL